MAAELKKFEIPWPQEISANFLLKASKLVNKIKTTRKIGRIYLLRNFLGVTQ